MSGDAPSSLVISRMVWLFSPRERGCARGFPDGFLLGLVFPA